MGSRKKGHKDSLISCYTWNFLHCLPSEGSRWCLLGDHLLLQPTQQFPQDQSRPPGLVSLDRVSPSKSLGHESCAILWHKRVPFPTTHYTPSVHGKPYSEEIGCSSFNPAFLKGSWPRADPLLGLPLLFLCWREVGGKGHSGKLCFLRLLWQVASCWVWLFQAMAGDWNGRRGVSQGIPSPLPHPWSPRNFLRQWVSFIVPAPSGQTPRGSSFCWVALGPLLSFALWVERDSC